MAEENPQVDDINILVQRYDVKLATHIGAIIAVTFGSFTLLGLLQGKGFPPQSPQVWWLFLAEAVFLPLMASYAICRAIQYSAMAEGIVRRRSELINLARTALEYSTRERKWLTWLPRILHSGNRGKYFAACLGVSAYVLWLVTIYAVLTLPHVFVLFPF